MPDSQISEIRAALEAALLTVTVENGYSLTIQDGHIYRKNLPAVTNDQTDSKYPKFFLVIDSGSNQGLPSNRFEKTINYILGIVLKDLKDPEAYPLQKRIEDAIDDIERLSVEQSTLNDTVNEFNVRNYTTDSGVLYPEAVALVFIELKYFRQR